jgi:hypothetical protein
MANLGDMVVRIVGDTTGLNKSLTDSQKKMASFGVNAAAVVAAVTAVTKAVADAVKDFTAYGSAIYDASQKTGLSTDAIQEWKFIAEQTGTTLEAITGAVGMMTRGLQTNAETYKKLGIEIQNADGTFRTTTEIFNETVKTLSAMTDETERDQMAFKLLGRSAQSLIPILNSGSDGIAEMRKQAHEMGIVLEEDAISNADKLGDSTDALKAAFKSAAASMVNEMAPALIAVANGLTSVITKTVAAKENFKAYEAFTGGAALALKDLEKSLRFVAEERATLERELAAGLAAGRNVAGISARLDVIKTQEAELRKLVKAEAEAVKYAQLKAEADAKAALAAAAAASAATTVTDGVKEETDAVIELEKAWASYGRNSVAVSEQATQAIQKTADTQHSIKSEIEAANEAWMGYAKSIESVVKPVFEEIGESLVEGTFQWKNLATVAVNSIGNIVSALGDQLAAESAAALIKAIAALASIVNAGLAPGYFAQSAVLAGGAAAAWTSAAALKTAKFAEGGVVQPVPGGVQATVAEAGMAEAIIPLDRLDRMLENAGSVGAGGDMTRLIVNLDSRPLLDKIFSATRNRTVLIDSGAVV